MRFAQFSQDGNTPLHFAAQEGRVEMVEYLINKMANINAKNTKVSRKD